MKRKRVDLHVHSGYSSDGTFGVHELFAQAKELHMEGLVIADHDTWEAWEEAEQESELTGIRTIPALELSCVDESRMVHILGYGIDTKGSHRLSETVKRIQQSRIGILPQIQRNLEREGFFVDMERVNQLAYPHPAVITNFADAILQDPRNGDHPKLVPYRPGGEKSDVPYIRFIKDYLVAGSKCYVPEYIVDIFEGIRMIREAKGVPVLAHPGEWFTTRDENKMERMLECGLQGMEVYTPYHSPEQTAYYHGLAAKFGLLQTAGSDYHDISKKPGHWMGMVEAASLDMFDALQRKIDENRQRRHKWNQ